MGLNYSSARENKLSSNIFNLYIEYHKRLNILLKENDRIHVAYHNKLIPYLKNNNRVNILKTIIHYSIIIKNKK